MNNKIKLNIKTICFLFLLLSFSCFPCAWAVVNVVTTTTDLADIAKQVGGEHVKVQSIAKGYQDPHFVEPKPSFMLILQKADLYLVTGLDLEMGWSPPLEEGSRNPKIVKGGENYVDCSINISPLEVPQGKVDRSQGDVHPYGNPHYLLDPMNAIPVARTIAGALKRKDPANADYYERNLQTFINQIQSKQSEWVQKMESCQGLKVVVYHRLWTYFVKRFGIRVVAEIEPKPGISPSPAHIAEVINKMKQENVKIILTNPFYERKIPDMIAKNTGAKVLVLPSMAGGVKGADTYIQMMDYIINQITSNK